MGSLDTHDSLCRHLAAEARTAILAVDYRLSPEHPHPAPLEDARAALTWLRENGRRHGLDPESLAVAGDSEGAHLAAALAREDPHIAGQLLLYPVVSAATDTASYRRLSRGFPLTAATMRWFMDLYTDGRTEPGEAIVDLAVDPRSIPTFLCTVGHDPLCDDGLTYAAALTRAGAEVQHVHLAQHAHGIFTSAGAVPTAERVLASACAFL
ncbi:alpha/beta hydrolase [Streptomyces sp. NPDC006450]|uniref:alpha/beta hydrolase n=1 Tax=Streptomyces sp. NPDC006450 TaxID=3155458 RepID=UPI0033A5C94C